MKFNRTKLKLGEKIAQPTQEQIKQTVGLHRASLADAFTYGGDLTREALSAILLRHEHKSVIVDVKVSMLMKGMCPAIPGWHTDGVPRTTARLPRISAQEDAGAVSPRFHLLVTGQHCLTEFMTGEVDIDVPDDLDTDLYKSMSEQVNQIKKVQPERFIFAPSCTVVEWDWWQIHQGIISQGAEWRYMIRVTETDHQKPETDLRKVLRIQQQVYAPLDFGW